MAWRGAALGATIACVIAACGASGAPSPIPVPTSTGSATTKPTASPTIRPTEVPPSTTPAMTATSSPISTPVTVPPKPTGVSFNEGRVGDDPPSTEITQTVTWSAPRNQGVEIRVFGVVECVGKPAKPSPGTQGPCLVEHTPLPASVRTLLATGPASDGRVSWSSTGTFDCEVGLAYNPRGPAYHSIVLAAYGGSDHSIFAIAEPGGWFQPGSTDIIC